jgi:hypothetical protein
VSGRKTAAERAKGSRPAVRERLASDFEAEYDAVMGVVRAGLEATKTRRGWCKTCKKAVYVEVEDVGAAMKAAEFLANQGLGRPGEDQSGRGGGDFVVERYVVEPEDDGAAS